VDLDIRLYSVLLDMDQSTQRFSASKTN